jgi:hypothetical protein
VLTCKILTVAAVSNWRYSECFNVFSPYVVRCVVYILENKEFNDSELREILGFIQACTHNTTELDSLRQVIFAGANCYKKYLNHDDTRTAEITRNLLGFCNEFRFEKANQCVNIDSTENTPLELAFI